MRSLRPSTPLLFVLAITGPARAGADEPSTKPTESKAFTGGGDERVGQAQQSITPVGPVLCGLASLIATTVGANACASWRGTSSEYCNVANFGSGAAWVFACALMF